MTNKNNTSNSMRLKMLLVLPLVSLIFSGNALYASSESVKANLSDDPQISVVSISGDIADLKKTKTDSTSVQNTSEKPLTMVEEMPKFEGGEVALMQFIATNINYPIDALEMGIQGRVLIRFVVNKEGDVGEIEIMRGVSPSCDAEAKRVISLMPKWKPGTQDGKAVSVYYVLPITFKL